MPDTQPPTGDPTAISPLDFSWMTDWLFPPANRVRRKWSEDELRQLIREEVFNLVDDVVATMSDTPELADFAAAFNTGVQRGLSGESEEQP